MEGKYEVLLNNAPVGVLQIGYKGLYCCISCSCKLPQDKIYRLVALGETTWENIGIPVPDGEYFRLEKKVSAKSWNMQNNRFLLYPADMDIDSQLMQPRAVRESESQPLNTTQENPKKENSIGERAENPDTNEELFLPIDPEKPFGGIQELQHASLQERDGTVGALISTQDPAENQNASDSPTGQ